MQCLPLGQVTFSAYQIPTVRVAGLVLYCTKLESYGVPCFVNQPENQSAPLKKSFTMLIFHCLRFIFSSGMGRPFAYGLIKWNVFVILDAFTLHCYILIQTLQGPGGKPTNTIYVQIIKNNLSVLEKDCTSVCRVFHIYSVVMINNCWFSQFVSQKAGFEQVSLQSGLCKNKLNNSCLKFSPCYHNLKLLTLIHLLDP